MTGFRWLQRDDAAGGVCHAADSGAAGGGASSPEAVIAAAAKAAGAGGKAAVAEPPKHSFFMQLRGWVDALVIAYVLAMFIRTYAVELFKIPTGSMTPTLIGDARSLETDYDKNGETDQVLFYGNSVMHVFLREGGVFTKQMFVFETPDATWDSLVKGAQPRHDMIMVNKFLYWFTPPKRGDIIVFKVPDRPELDGNLDRSTRNPWNPKTPIYIKRCVGLPGDEIHISRPKLEHARYGDPNYWGKTPGGLEVHLLGGPVAVNGKPLADPELFERVMHFPFGFGAYSFRGGAGGAGLVAYLPEAQDFKVPEGQIWQMGDNSSNSTDSRAWGGVPLENIRGKAILRYFPLRTFGFLDAVAKPATPGTAGPGGG